MDVVDNVPLPPCASARHSSAVPDTPGTPPMVTKRPFDTTTPGSAAKMAVSTRSRLDYAIVFNKRVPGVEESVSCLFETKFKLDVNAYAQVCLIFSFSCYKFINGVLCYNRKPQLPVHCTLLAWDLLPPLILSVVMVMVMVM